MRKEEYLKQLEEGLKGLREEVRKDIVADIREHFEMREQEGLSEDETAERLGDPAVLARQFMASMKIEKAQSTKKGRDITAAVFSAAGTGMLSFFGVVITIIGYALFIAFILASAGVTAAGIAALLYAIINTPDFNANFATVLILVSTGCIALGVLLMTGSTAFLKLINKGILRTLGRIQNG